MEQPGDGGRVVDGIVLTPRMDRNLRQAARLARQHGHNYIGTEHLLLVFLNEDGGIAPSMLRQQSDWQAMTRALEEILASPPEQAG